MCSLAVNDRRQAEGCNFSRNTIKCLTNLRYCVSTTFKYRAEEPRYLWYCGTKKYRKGDGTGTVEKWYRGSTVVPRNTSRLPIRSSPLVALLVHQHGWCRGRWLCWSLDTDHKANWQLPVRESAILTISRTRINACKQINTASAAHRVLCMRWAARWYRLLIIDLTKTNHSTAGVITCIHHKKGPRPT